MDAETIVARALEDAGTEVGYHASTLEIVGGQLIFSIDIGPFGLPDAKYFAGQNRLVRKDPDDIEEAWETLVDAVRAYMDAQI